MDKPAGDSIAAFAASEPPPRSAAAILALVQGGLFLGAALAANPWTLKKLLWKGAVFSSSGTAVLLAADLALIAVGAWYLWRRPAVAKKTFLSLVSLAVCLACLEVLSFATGFFAPAEYRSRHRMFYAMQEPDPELGFRNRPDLRGFRLDWADGTVSGVYDTDESGYRNPPGALDSAEYIVVGDSFAFGEWVERSRAFFGVLEQRLGEPFATLGVSGYDMSQYEIVTRRLLERRRPKVLILCVFANDLRPARDPEFMRDFYARTGRTKYSPSSIYMRSFTLQLLQRGKNALTEIPGAARAPNGLWLYEGKGADPEYFSGGHHVAVEGLFVRLLDRVKEAGVRPVVLLLPTKESANKDAFTALFSGKDVEMEEEAYKRLGSLAGEAGAECLDLTPLFREKSKSEPLYFERDPHWNEAGHLLAARAVEALFR